ncbi:hypothetical protein BGZ98_002102 [Dissophora globulifera]|nr:hypothetical protein BGZ98_002102 [Dissophora globulifera]
MHTLLQSRSSPSVASTSSTLRSTAAKKMKDELREHFQAFKGASWTLPSSAVVEDLLANHAETLRKESSLHSFVIDDANALLILVKDEADKEVITNVLLVQSEKTSPTLSEKVSTYMGLFNKKPDELEEFLANDRNNAMSGDMDKEFAKRVWFAIEQIHFAYWA